ncbi:MAG: hypothetical protein ORN27_11205, partial [Rhodoluna sp.]|nr:hypothetical protein [Rhodoluna sp.]
MKRLIRFVLLTLGYLAAPWRVVARRINFSRFNGRRFGVISLAAAALLGIVIVGNIFAPPAQAVVIRSSTGSDACTVAVGVSSAATVTQSGNYCVTTITSNTTIAIPSYVTSAGVVVVGGGAGAGPDGSSGGGGGEVRYNASQVVTAGGTATVSIGGAGSYGSYSGNPVQSGGGATTLSGAGFDYQANGGSAQTINWSGTGPAGGAGGTGGRGGTGANGGAGGYGPYAVCNLYNNGSPGNSGPQITGIGGLGATYFGGGGAGGTGAQTNNSNSYYGLGAAGGAGGGGRGANLRYATDDVTWVNGASTGHNANYYGGGGGGGAACDAYGSQNGVYQRTSGGSGYQGVVIVSWQENKMGVSQAPDGCIYNAAEACLVSAKIQLQDTSGNALSTSGVPITVTSSLGTAAGTTTVNTDASGVATFNNFWITGTSLGNQPVLTFESAGYRNVQQTITMKGYAETLNVVAGASSNDTNGSFLGTTGIWLATSSSSNISVTTLQNELANRNVVLRAFSSTTTLGDVLLNNAGTLSETASSSRTLNIKASRNVQIYGNTRLTSSGNPLNLVITTDSDFSYGGGFHMDGQAAAYSIETNGGAVAIGGGTGTTTWNSLTVPSGYAAGYANTTGNWWGIQLGVNTNITNNLLIKTAGGPIRMYGLAYAATNVSLLYGIAWESGKIDSGSGSIELNGLTSGSPSTATSDNWGVALGANHVQTNDVPVLVSSGAVTMTGSLDTPGTSNYWGVAVGYSDLTSGSAGISITSPSRSIIWNSTTVRSPLSISGTTTWLSGSNTYTDNVTATATAGDAYFGGTQSLTTSGSTFTAKASANITFDTAAATSITTNGGNMLFWSDTDFATSPGGGIKTNANTTINSNGGSITFSGGTDYTTGRAKGTSTTNDTGVWLSGSVSAAGGNII